MLKITLSKWYSLYRKFHRHHYMTYHSMYECPELLLISYFNWSNLADTFRREILQLKFEIMKQIVSNFVLQLLLFPALQFYESLQLDNNNLIFLLLGIVIVWSHKIVVKVCYHKLKESDYEHQMKLMLWLVSSLVVLTAGITFSG